MPATKLKEFLNRRGIRYESIEHSPAFTAPETAASVHVTGRDFAKTVMIWIEGELAMIVLPANRKIVLSDLRDMLDCPDVHLATEAEFQNHFPDCEIGAMPPFGNLYGVPAYVSQELASQRQVAFNAGTHHEVIKMSFDDFVASAEPIVLDFMTA